MKAVRLILVILFSIALGLQLRAQSCDTVVSLLTCAPGSEIYELEGHTAIRIKSPQLDAVVSYGVFDFHAPNFVYRFVKGETDYMAAAIPWQFFAKEYEMSHRRVDEQVLNLTQAQTRKLVGLIEENLLPQNRTYRYNYVKDNCATRPLLMIEKAIEDSLTLGHTVYDVQPYPASFRDVMRSYHKNYPWYQFGIDLALGSGIDYPLSSREYSFAPLLLEQQIAGATVGGSHLAQEARVVISDNGVDPVNGPTPFYLTPLFVCWLVLALLVWVTVRDNRRGKVTKWVDAVYFGIMGLAGLLLTFLIFVSVHEATSPNYLYIWLNPFCLIPAIFIWLKNCKKVVLSYQIINFAAVLILCLGWWWIPQSANAAFLPLVLGDLLRSASYIRLNLSKGTK